MFNFIKKIKDTQGNIALILVIMITSLTLVSAVSLALINISDLTANYHLIENEELLAQRDACLEDALYTINNNVYATGTYALNIGNINCNYEISSTVAGAKVVTTTAASFSDIGYWQGGIVMGVNVSSTPITITSYRDIVNDAWSYSGWTNRIKVSVQPSGVSGNVFNFPVYVDLNDLGADFFDVVDAAGDDIVVTTVSGGIKLFREVVNLDTDAETGQIYFKAPFLAASTATDFYIYFGNASATETNDAEIWSDYILVQHLDEDPTGGAPQMIDSTTSDLDGTVYGDEMGADDLIDGVSGNAIDFDNPGKTESNRVQITANTSIHIPKITISLWANLTTYGHVSTWDERQGPIGQYYDFSMYNISSNAITVVTEPADCEDNIYTSSDSGEVPDLSEWAHLAYNFDGETKTVKIYLDGEEVKSNQSDSLPSSITSCNSGYLCIGCGHSGAWYSHNGAVDEVRISNKVLSADWLAMEHNNFDPDSTFYTTSTVEVLAEAPAGCGGEEMFDYCWYKASAVSMSCNSVCAENGLSCVSNVSYSDLSCTLNVAMGSDSPGTCSVGCDDSDLTYSPSNLVGADYCMTTDADPAYVCSDVEIGFYKILCACE
jgi:hypothetical protein